jgi:putative hemolysin
MKQFYGVMLSLALLGGMFMNGCAPANPASSNPAALPTQPTQTPAPASTISGMANPASVNCEQKGNRLEIRTAADGSQVGICIFPDGSECEEWAFMRGECGPGTRVPANSTATVAIPTDTPVAPAAAVVTAIPGQKAVIDPAVQKKIVGAAESLLAKKLKVKPGQITLVSIEPASWGDACLGLPGPGEMCAEVIIDGFKVVLAVNGQNYTIRTDQAGRNVRLEP